MAESKALVRAHIVSLGPRELTEFDAEAMDRVVGGLLDYPWFTRNGVTFQGSGPEFFVAKISYAELREL